MELIRISQTKLKIMLSADDMKRYEFDTAALSDVSGRAALRNILNEAREKCGFDAACDRVFVQYYPEKSGGCEMFITKLTADPTPSHVAHRTSRVGAETYDSGYIIYSFAAVGDLLRTCKCLRASRYTGESRAYRIIDKRRYYLVLTSETYLAAENNGTRCESSYFYVLTEHGELMCTDAVEKLGTLA